MRIECCWCVLAVGYPSDGDAGTNAGKARVFEYDGSNWVQLGGDITGNEGDWAGYVSLNEDGTILAVGAPGAGEQAVRVFQYNSSGSWNQLGGTIEGPASSNCGRSTALNDIGNTLVVACHSSSEYYSSEGNVRVFQYNGSDWNQMGSEMRGGQLSAYFGSSVDINGAGNIIAVGAYGYDGIYDNSGLVRIYKYDGSDWVQLGHTIEGQVEEDQFGNAVALNKKGNIVAGGALTNTGTAMGNFRVFYYDGSWSQVGQTISGQSNGDKFGKSVALSSNCRIVAAGAVGTDEAGANAGHAMVFAVDGWTTISPTAEPSLSPSNDPTVGPSVDPTLHPTMNPTLNPTESTATPSAQPTSNPTNSRSVYIHLLPQWCLYFFW